MPGTITTPVLPGHERFRSSTVARLIVRNIFRHATLVLMAKGRLDNGDILAPPALRDTEGILGVAAPVLEHQTCLVAIGTSNPVIHRFI